MCDDVHTEDDIRFDSTFCLLIDEMLKEMAASGTYVPAEPALASCPFVRESPVLAIYTALLFR